MQGKYGLLSIFPTLLYFMKQTHCFPGFFSASDTHCKVCKVSLANNDIFTRVRKYAKFGVFYAKIVQMTPQRLRRESLRLQKFSVTNREPLRLQKFSVTNTVLSLPFSQQIQFTLIVNVVNLN